MHLRSLDPDMRDAELAFYGQLANRMWLALLDLRPWSCLSALQMTRQLGLAGDLLALAFTHDTAGDSAPGWVLR